MTKHEFIKKLKVRLVKLPKTEVDERLNFYSEMIDDRIEEGLTEEEAVANIGSVDEIASQVVGEIPLSKIIKENIKPKKKVNAFTITLLILGSPIWVSLLLSIFAIVLSLYVSLWAVVISLWAIFVALIVGAVGCLILGLVFTFTVNKSILILCVSATFISLGLAIFLFYGCLYASKGTLALAKLILKAIKNSFIKEKEYA